MLHASPPAVSPSLPVFLFCFPSPCFSHSFLWLQDYSAVGQSRCALDYEAEISLRSSCLAQFIKGGGGGGVWADGGISLRETKLSRPLHLRHLCHPLHQEWYRPLLLEVLLVGPGPGGMLTHRASACHGFSTCNLQTHTYIRGIHMHTHTPFRTHITCHGSSTPGW